MKPRVKKVRIQTTLSPSSIERAERLCELFGFTDLNELLERLILDEFERRQGPLRFEDQAEAKRKKKAA